MAATSISRPGPRPRVFEVEVTSVVRVTVFDQDVLERVTGAEGNEWRSHFYGSLLTAEGVAEHLAYNYQANGIGDVSRLEGWGDVDSSAVDFCTLSVELDGRELPAGAVTSRSI